MQALTIEAVAEGGYFVREAQRSDRDYCPPLLACTTLDEALAFTRAKLEPSGPQTVSVLLDGPVMISSEIGSAGGSGVRS